MVAVGLHLNLTLGRPLIKHAKPSHLGSDGRFLPIGKLIRRAAFQTARPGRLVNRFAHQLDSDAIRAEISAQIAAFRDAVGALPDFIDGHQHVHVLNPIRRALLDAIAEFAWERPPLVRVPSSEGHWRRTPRNEWGKRAVIAALSAGMRDELAQARLPANDTFAGFSSFAIGNDYRTELDAALQGGGTCHLVMCHPGHVDAVLAARGDPVIERRAEELAGILAVALLPQCIWHPTREPDGTIDWLKAMAS